MPVCYNINMQIIADLQIHSKYSRATSPKMDLMGIAHWASLKGIDLIATGDWTHPLWFREIKTNLKEKYQGIYTLKEQSSNQPLKKNQKEVNFLLSTEISSIYSQGGKVRRVHNLIFSPSIETCEKIIKALQNRGCKLMSDGRPIIGLSSKALLELALTVDENILFIPAHIWTPWFALFGSKSGFDSIEECFGNLSSHIYGIETGLSSDPRMNWQIKELENRSILSFSDAHSGPKLGREATIFVSRDKLHPVKKYSYNDIADTIRQKPNSKLKISYTIEFFPEEGKYHWSGHRNCNIRYSPQEVKKKGSICPVCQKPLTIGVENRVINLASKIIDKDDLVYLKNKAGVTFVYDKEKKQKPFVSLIPLLEILLELHNRSQTKAKRDYDHLTSLYASEFEILLKRPYEEIEKFAGKQLMEAIKMVRERKVFVDPGYDGVFGKVKIKSLKNDQRSTNQQQKEKKQLNLF